MSDAQQQAATPRTDAEAYSAMKPIEDEWVPDFEFVKANFARTLERACAALRAERDALVKERDGLRESLAYVRGLGEVYVYPSDWNCAKQGGYPPIDAFQRVDLSAIGANK